MRCMSDYVRLYTGWSVLDKFILSVPPVVAAI